MDSERFLTAKAVSALTTFSRATIDRKVDTGEFPAPVYISQHRKAWSERAVRDWMETKIRTASGRARFG